jgi:hypothetical protein
MTFKHLLRQAKVWVALAMGSELAGPVEGLGMRAW